MLFLVNGYTIFSITLEALFLGSPNAKIGVGMFVTFVVSPIGAYTA